jgi:hypothetical protein
MKTWVQQPFTYNFKVQCPSCGFDFRLKKNKEIDLEDRIKASRGCEPLKTPEKNRCIRSNMEKISTVPIACDFQ